MKKTTNLNLEQKVVNEMKTIKCRIPQNDAYIIPIGDLHVGDKNYTKYSENKIQGYINWVKSKPNAKIFLNGDILNCATRNSATSPFDQKLDLKEQIEYAVNLLRPVKDKIVGAIDGNHEQRLKDFTGYSPTISICDRLGIEYCGNSAVVLFQIGKHYRGKGRENTPKTVFTGYFHHTTGGGSTPGGRINRVDKMRQLLVNADFYCGSHNHMLGAVPVQAYEIIPNSGNTRLMRQVLVDCGGYLEWRGSYAEAKQLAPLKTGSPKIHLQLDNGEKDIHVSL